mmetsp:Transcript_40210/g.95543  ORF Transcript_40210/g.95543 Transcript_40210/m.95543 type:complete len:197 (+) Transcript_40210:485-1075(+)
MAWSDVVAAMLTFPSVMRARAFIRVVSCTMLSRWAFLSMPGFTWLKSSATHVSSSGMYGPMPIMSASTFLKNTRSLAKSFSVCPGSPTIRPEAHRQPQIFATRKAVLNLFRASSKYVLATSGGGITDRPQHYWLACAELQPCRLDVEQALHPRFERLALWVDPSKQFGVGGLNADKVAGRARGPQPLKLLKRELAN